MIRAFLIGCGALLWLSCAQEERAEPFRIHYTDGPQEFAGVRFGLNMRDAEQAIERQFGRPATFYNDLEFSPDTDDYYFTHTDSICGVRALLRWGLNLRQAVLNSVQVELYTDSITADSCINRLINLQSANYVDCNSMQEFYWCTRDLYHTDFYMAKSDTLTILFLGWDRQFASYKAAQRFIPTWNKNF